MEKSFPGDFKIKKVKKLPHVKMNALFGFPEPGSICSHYAASIYMHHDLLKSIQGTMRPRPAVVKLSN